MNQDFEEYYLKHFGDRWPLLRAALKAPESQVARLNDFSEDRRDAGPLWQNQSSLLSEFAKEIPRNNDGLLAYYIMDPASVLVARALAVSPGETVLDMCAAPGGKSLILAEALAGQGELYLNELSQGRRERLKIVLQQYMKREQRDLIRLTGKDGGLFAKSHPDFFDRILIDAPCSGERHLINNQEEYTKWNPSRVRQLSQRQYALLTAGLIALKKGGVMVYSTCALTPDENDAVIAKLCKKKTGVAIERIEHDLPFAERTEFGYSFFPDKAGIGPMYFCRMRKTEP